MSLRIDRLITLYVASPCLHLLGRGDQSIPVLMYHSITDRDESNVHAYYRTVTAPRAFARQLACLKAEGYSSCSLAFAIDNLRSQASAREKLVVITFDDGFSDFYQNAFPLLNQYGFSATVFLPTAYIGDSPLQFKGKDCLTWPQVRDLNKSGISFGSHTVTHPWLVEMSPPQVKDEVVNSKKTIEEKLGCGVESFAYPYAFPQTNAEFKKMLRDALSEAGYANGVCTIVGRATRRSEPLFLERLPVNSCDDNELFGAKLSGAYDWVAKSQSITKTVKAQARKFIGAKRIIYNELPTVHRPS